MSRPLSLLALPLAAAAALAAPSGYRPIDSLAERYGFPEPRVTRSAVTLRRRNSTLVFETYSRQLHFNGVKVWLNRPTLAGDGAWNLADIDIGRVLHPLLASDSVLADAGRGTLVIDPGHGGADSGAVGHRRVIEKKAVLDIALRLREALRSSGLKVFMTRNRDRTLGLADRAAVARTRRADMFVSIHLNAADNGAAQGIETYVLPAPGCPSTAGTHQPGVFAGNRFDGPSMVLAYCIQRSLLASLERPDRGIRRARFDVLKRAPCPAVLVECGFISNPVEAGLVIDRRYRQAAAEGLAGGILEYRARVARASGTAAPRTGVDHLPEEVSVPSDATWRR